MAGVGVRVGRCRGRRCRGAESPVLRPHTSVATLHASAATPLRPTGDGPCQIPSPKVQSEPTELGFQRGDLTPITGRAPESQNRPAPRGGRAGFRMWKGPPSQLWEESAGRPNQYSLDYVGVTREPRTSHGIVPRKLVAHCPHRQPLGISRGLAMRPG